MKQDEKKESGAEAKKKVKKPKDPKESKWLRNYLGGKLHCTNVMYIGGFYQGLDKMYKICILNFFKILQHFFKILQQSSELPTLVYIHELAVRA